MLHYSVLICFLAFLSHAQASKLPHSHRQLITTKLSTATTLLNTFVTSSIAHASTSSTLQPKKAVRPYLYSIEFTSPPSLLPRTKIGEGNSIERFCKADVVLLGEHPRKEEDKSLCLQILQNMIKTNPTNKRIALGLEMIEQPFQSYLDEYLKSKDPLEDADRALFENTQWNSRWKFAFEPYLPLLHYAKTNQIPLVALGAPSETINTVLSKGFEGLSDDDRAKYIVDGQGFVDFVRLPGFKRYTDRVILPSYEFYAANKLLGDNPSPEKFFASRIFKDEAIAGKAAMYINANPDSMMVALMDKEHTKFGYGVQERLKYRLASLRGVSPPSAEDLAVPPSRRILSSIGNGRDVLSVLLNPTARDSTSETAQLTLSLAYGQFLDESRPLADYIWFSTFPESKLLTRPKNPVNNEGEKPPGESSIIGAF